MLVKVVSLGLAVGLVLWVFFYLPKRLKKGAGAKLRYIVFTVLAIVFAMVLLKTFL